MPTLTQPWKFWIDVGGTFTDYVTLTPDGHEHFAKVLSSGFVKGNFHKGKDSDKKADRTESPNVIFVFLDPGRKEPSTFWNGATIRLFDAAGANIWQGIVDSFERINSPSSQTGAFTVSGGDNLDLSGIADSTIRYELDAGLPAPILAIHLSQKIPIQSPLLPCQVNLGSTRGTNALLTRNGARTALVTSTGFRDFLRIGDQTRTRLFALTVEKLEPLFETAIEVRERLLADGTIEQIPDEADVIRQLTELKKTGIESLAICLMFGFRYPKHEQQIAEIATRIGFRSIRCSSDVAPLIKLIPRGETTVLDAYLDSVIASYLAEVKALLPSGSILRLMTSSGGLVSPQRFSGKDSVLSGPAGGVVGAARVGQQLGFERVIGFDMGGTSTDVCRFDGQFTRSFESRKAGVRIVTPMLEVETVAAGGGSVCWFDGTKLRVGPQSAGADPGPACYGRGGPLAITDINLYLGRFQPASFPFALDLAGVERRLDELTAQLDLAGFSMNRDELANGFLQIANHNMSAAIQSVSVAKGFDPRTYLLVSFGGAGSQHCCGVADNLGIRKILDHPQSSVLSAVGIRLADQTAHRVEGINESVPSHDDVDGILQIQDCLNQAIVPRLVSECVETLRLDGNQAIEYLIEASLDFRYRGTETFLSIPFAKWKQGVSDGLPDSVSGGSSEGSKGSLAEGLKEFLRLHQQQFGYLQNRSIEIIAARVDARLAGERLKTIEQPETFALLSVTETQPMFSHGTRLEGAVYERASLQSGDLIAGPAVIADLVSTTIIDKGWSAHVYENGILLIEKNDSEGLQPSRQAATDQANQAQTPDPVQLEIFNSHFSTIAEQMGIALQKTSVSVNVKERLDFSCAIFSACGDLVVNAPHIPVHLGAMSETVRSIIQLNPDVRSGDVYATNDPYAGGSHLPDVTAVTPVFSADGSTLWFWVASRSHHAEIGGTAPGSMPANARSLGEEGVLIQNFKLIGRDPHTDDCREYFDQLRHLLVSYPFPSRSPDENIADLRAQVAANRTGANQLLRLVEQYSLPTVSSYMKHIQDAAESQARRALTRVADGEYSFEDALDNGGTIRVKLTKRYDRLTIDFSGTDPVLPDNLNANRAIVSAAVMYVIRLMIGEEIPLNEGVMKPVTLILPICFLNPTPDQNPFKSPPIVGGNVETSQRIVDCLLGALGLAAASQGTMNNWLIGNETFGFYETVGGGAGATATGHGADAVHTHMTNTRLTDPEIMETRYPVVIRQFAIRQGSGGAGQHRGGHGMVREIEFREPLTLSLLTNRRTLRPFGLAGGEPGQAGNNLLIRADQIDQAKPSIEVLPGRCETRMQIGDRLRLETPGGGGFGSRASAAVVD